MCSPDEDGAVYGGHDRDVHDGEQPGQDGRPDHLLVVLPQVWKGELRKAEKLHCMYSPILQHMHVES